MKFKGLIKKERRRKGREEKLLNEPEIPMSYPKMRPLDAATMQVMITESVILPSKAVAGPLTAMPPTAILDSSHLSGFNATPAYCLTLCKDRPN